MTLYSPGFFAQQTPVALQSARAVLPGVLHDTGAKSVVDVGCGVGAWASVAKEHGCRIQAVDGYVPPEQLLIHPSEFYQRDLTYGYYPCSDVDLAICLEVGEHLPESSAEDLVAGLCEARYVLFSAAHPGQGGIGHVNEQWPTWWAALFREHDYHGSSLIQWRNGRRLWADKSVQDYYLENAVLYSHVFAPYVYDDVVDVIHPTRTGLWP